MSTAETIAPGALLGNYRIGERVGTSVWQAEDVRSGRRVAVKLLTRSLPAEQARRDALVRGLRLGAAIYHPALVNIIEIAVEGDSALLVMEWFDGLPVSQRYRGAPASRGDFFRVAYQITDALRMLHSKEIVHGNIAGDSVLVAENGHARLAGLNVGNLVQRQGGSAAFQQRGSDLNSVSYMAPEQITGNPPISAQTDIFSLGVVFYEIATGKRPYLGTTPAEVAHKIVAEAPASPKAVHPTIDNAVLSVLGKCLFKDSFKRIKEAKMLLADITKSDAAAAEFASEIAKAAAPQTTAPKADATRHVVLLIGEIANYAELNAVDPAAAQQQASRMQQTLGEAVYLFDGQVVDPFGPRMIGELPSVESALEAARKGEFDLSPEQQGDAPMLVRLLLHAGDVETRDGAVVGGAIARASDVLPQLPPLKLFLTEDFVKKAGRGAALRLKDFGARGGVKLYTIAAAEAPAHETMTEPDTASIEAAEVEAAQAEAAAAIAAKQKRSRMVMAIAAAALLVVALAVFLLMKREKPLQAAAVTSTAPAPLPPATAATPRKILLQPFAVLAPDPALKERGEAIRLAAAEVLRGFPELRLADAQGHDVTPFTATLRAGAAGPEIVPEDGAGKQAVAASALLDAASGIQAMVGYVAQELKVPPRTASSEALNAFADAVAAIGANDDGKAAAAIRAATKADPAFLAAQALAMRYFSRKGADADALAAAKQVAALDPDNVDAARQVARAGLKSGDVASAIGSYGAVLKHERGDAEALNTIARFAFSANDSAKFSSALRRRPQNASFHAPDLLLAGGRFDAAVDKYYDAEQQEPNNPSLSLKIGRLAVLRHSTEIAGMELKKLEASDPDYGAHVLKAYMAAQKGVKGEAQSEMHAAQAASKPGDDFYTSTAEIAAIGGDARGVVDALEKAAERKEPTASYVLANPLFGFLQSDSRFLRVRERLAAQQNEIRAALANVAL
jgi:tetratricopeptide (TPR) repeat protein